MAYRISAINFAQINASESILFRGGVAGKSRTIGCFAYLLSDGGRAILVDTGVADIDVINTTVRGGGQWQRIDTLEDGLARHGFKPDDITAVIVTHAHYDHISNLPKCRNARIYINQKALDTLFDKKAYGCQLDDVRRFVRRQQEEGTVVPVADSLAIDEDILIRHVSGHTRGSQMVFANTHMGPCLISGDAVFLLENVSAHRPIGLTEDMAQSQNAVEICRHFDGIILTGHDLKTTDILKAGGKDNV